MKSDLHEPSGPALGDTSRTLDPGSGQMRGQAQSRALEGLGYPFRAIVTLMAVLALAVIWLVLPVSQEGFLRPTEVPVGRGAGQGLAWTLTVPIVLSWLVLIWLRTRQLSRAREQNVHVLTALGAATSNIPVNLRTRMPLVLVTGDALGNLFDRIAGERRLAHVGDGAIWLRADRLQDLPRLAVAVKQWRDGRAPDGVVLSVAPALHAGEDVLTQNLRVVRQSVADASRMLGVRLPGFVAVYQRLTNAPATLTMPQWYGVSSATRLADASRFEAVVQVAETEVERAGGDRAVAARAASLASIVGWTQRVVIGVLSDRRQPATPWALFGAGWIDCGPASGPGRPWERDVEMQTRVVPPALPASPLPWPLPQPLIEAMPRRLWMSPRLAALAPRRCSGCLRDRVGVLGRRQEQSGAAHPYRRGSRKIFDDSCCTRRREARCAAGSRGRSRPARPLFTHRCTARTFLRHVPRCAVDASAQPGDRNLPAAASAACSGHA
ncbi:hypothetical protein OKW35_004158 [Paraburkholderia sp. MM5477-R1]